MGLRQTSVSGVKYTYYGNVGGGLLSATDAPRYVWFQLTQLFCYGVYSHRALEIAITILILLAGNVFVIVRWAVAALNRSVN